METHLNTGIGYCCDGSLRIWIRIMDGIWRIQVPHESIYQLNFNQCDLNIRLYTCHHLGIFSSMWFK